MDQTKKKGKKILQKIMDKSKKFSKNLNKTIKNKSSLKKCENFCKKDYMKYMDKKIKIFSKKHNMEYKHPTKEENEFTFNTCKKTFCNVKCDGYDLYGDKKRQLDFKKGIKDGFQHSYSKDKVKC